MGVVGKTDLVREFNETSGGELSESARFIVHGYEVDLGPGYHLEAVRERTVRDIMMPLSFTLPESAPIARAAALMAYEGVHRVVVISPAGNVVGILSSLDVLGWLARESGYLMSKDG
jgi:CBS-domain-containing membrane protein